MTRRIFDTYHASDAETSGIKKALDESGIEWFETQKGRWWVGSAALWISQDEDYAAARQVIDEFQQLWIQSVREQASRRGIRWFRLPAALVVIGIILYLATFWFWL